MRISDWSSDVCSSDLPAFDRALLTLTAMLAIQTVVNGLYLLAVDRPELARTFASWRAALPIGVLSLGGSTGWAVAVTDRKSVGEGKSVSVRVDLGGRRIIKKTKTNYITLSLFN